MKPIPGPTLSKHFMQALAFLVCLFALCGTAHAGRFINAATLNGASSVTVEPGEVIAVVVNVTTNNSGSGGNDWQSTGWRISTTAPGSVTCQNTGNHTSSGTYNESFNITAPTTPGTYNVYFIAYSDNACSLNASGTLTMAGTVVVRAYPVVTSMSAASTNPTSAATAVAWNVVFSRSVTGVDATDFSLVQASGVSGATITSVTGSGTAWTVNANTGSGTGTLGLNLVDNDSIVDSGGNKLGGNGTGNGNFTGDVYTIKAPFCSPPSNAPAGLALTCVCDTFGRSSLNPSTIYGGNWGTSNSDGIKDPYINQTTGLLRLTENTGNNAKAATVPSIFPAAGNYISVEFNHYAYNGSGADGIAVTLSDYAVPAVPGGYGGSLGYAPNSVGSKPGFAGGWVGVALDEYGNYQNPTEGRILGPGLRAESVGVRGPGSGANGYRWLGGTGSGFGIDSNASTTPAPGYMYQVIVDARNSASGTINVNVNRDTTTKDGSNYSSLFGPFNAYTEANYALSQGWISKLIPDYWKISFTGSTGGSTNIHEIGSLRVCAQTVYPDTGGTASGFSAIDEAYPKAPSSSIPAYQNFQTGHIYMKLAGSPFNLWVAALTGTGISTAYSATTNKYLAVKLVDNSDNVCGTDAARNCSSSCTNKPAVETGGTQIVGFTSADPGAKLSPAFTLNSSWKRLIAVIKECTTSACTSFTATAPACSADGFSVRPTGITSIISSNATNTSDTGTPIFKAGSGNFSLTATTAGVTGNASGYTGILKINNQAVQANGTATVAGALSPVTFPAATYPIAVPPTSTSTATGNFTYSEVGAFILPGYNPATDTTSPRGVFDGVSTATECNGLAVADCDTLKSATWTGIDSVSTKNDCISDSYANTKDATGKYGCNFGNIVSTSKIGRFVPDHFTLSSVMLNNRDQLSCTPVSPFTYMGERIGAQFTLTAKNAAEGTTKNYTGALAKLDVGTPANFALGALDRYSASTKFDITQITKANPGVVTTSAAHGYATGDTVYINDIHDVPDINDVINAKSMFEVNNRSYTVTVIDATHFSIDIDTSAYTAYVANSGGTVLKRATSGANLSPRLAIIDGGGNWGNGVASNIPLTFTFSRDASAKGPFISEFGIAPVDSDGVAIAPYDMDITTPAGNEHALFGLTSMRFGRLSIQNAYGSEKLGLPVSLQAQYWNGSAYVNNTADNCSPFDAANFSLAQQGTGATISTTITGGSTASRGSLTAATALRLTAPSPAPTGKGSVALSASTTKPSASWPLSGYLPGSGIETFGIYKAGPVIYLRELY